MLRIRTLGGLFAADAAGEPMGGAASQRRLLALLAVLAVAGDAGLSRDKLIAILWPDSEEERARHSLTQGLYAARRALGVDDLFVTGGDIRLNRDRIASDVQEFESALDADELGRAAALYQGPFLDGFYLPGSTEFEQWSSMQRQRLEDRAVGALDRLARAAEEAGELREALDWRRRLAAIRPLDAAVAVSLMQVLAQSGDRAGALQHARLHETLLRDQLGLDADPVVTALAERLREPVEWQAEGATATLAPPAPPEEPPPLPPVDEEEPSDVDDGPPRSPVRYVGGRTVTLGEAPIRVVPPPGRRRWRWPVAGALSLLALIAVVAVWQREPDPPPAAAPASLTQRLVVAPFRVSGASASLAYLRDGLVELLSTRLADDSTARSVDAGAVLAAWRATGVGRTMELPRDTVVALAGRLGAERVVLGSVVGTPSRIVLSADVVGVAGGALLGRASVEGPADSLSALVDRLAARLLVAGAGEEASLAAQTSGSLRALRAYLDGQAAFRRGSLVVAERRYDEALQLDSGFALAGLQLARTAERLHLQAVRARALAAAWRERDVLDERARALLVAMAGPRYPEPSPVEEAVAAWERLIDLSPDRAEPWYELGARLAREGALADPGPAARARSSLERALALQPGFVPAREVLAQLDV
ncbi:BTAD domain-containing putative transcriptional regulator, partial [Roseisolibacter sp. H3M3-2]|uniref:BTAD domain-containing putative transcriptional regulator n=1 Tax=Roseisolibacter sp. H3M3-2 TaxID=3031323 RepID=UPI0023DAA80A